MPDLLIELVNSYSTRIRVNTLKIVRIVQAQKVSAVSGHCPTNGRRYPIPTFRVFVVCFDVLVCGEFEAAAPSLLIPVTINDPST